MFLYIFVITIGIANINPTKEVVYYSDNININSTSYVPYTKEYTKDVLSYSEKKKIALKNYKLSEEKYNVVASIIASESKPNSYNESYAVASVIFNRTNSKRWVNHVNNIYGRGNGTSLYYQAIAPNQFTVYSSGSYKKYLNSVPKAVNEALIDLLYTEEPLHNYLSFRSSSYKGANTVQFEKGGNKYFGEIANNDVLNKK